MSWNAPRQMLENVAEQRAWKCSIGMVPDTVHMLQHFREMNGEFLHVPGLQG